MLPQKCGCSHHTYFSGTVEDELGKVGEKASGVWRRHGRGWGSRHGRRGGRAGSR